MGWLRIRLRKIGGGCLGWGLRMAVEVVLEVVFVEWCPEGFFRRGTSQSYGDLVGGRRSSS